MSKWTHKKDAMPKGRLKDRFLCYTVSSGKDYYDINIRTLKWMLETFAYDHNTFTHWQELPKAPKG